MNILSALKSSSRFLILYPVLLLASVIQAESFRTHGTNIITLENSFDKKSTVAKVNDCIAVRLPKDTTFIQGIEINIKVPKEVAEWRDSVAWSLYSSVSPQPSDGIIDYNGTRTETGTFDSLSLNLLIPLEKKNTIKRDAYSHLTEFIADSKDGFIFLRFQLVMKGVSDALMNSQFSVQAKPILIEKGIISLKTIFPKGNKSEPYTVFLDGNQAVIKGNEILTDTGIHNISIISDSYRNELRTVTVEQAKINYVEVKFRDIKPIIRLAAPEKTKIIFDDTELTAPVEPFHTTQGDHTIKFIIGDYEIVRTVTASNGRSYNIAINLEATVSEIED